MKHVLKVASGIAAMVAFFVIALVLCGLNWSGVRREAFGPELDQRGL